MKRVSEFGIHVYRSAVVPEGPSTIGNVAVVARKGLIQGYLSQCSRAQGRSYKGMCRSSRAQGPSYNRKYCSSRAQGPLTKGCIAAVATKGSIQEEYCSDRAQGPSYEKVS